MGKEHKKKVLILENSNLKLTGNRVRLQYASTPAGLNIYLEHHKSETFYDEYRRLLIENGIEFDEKYLL